MKPGLVEGGHHEPGDVHPDDRSVPGADGDGRDIVVHQGLMAPNGYDTVADLRRVALVRTMLVALVGLAAGYRGAINGWEVGGLGYPMEQQEGWEVAESDRTFARRSFIAEERVSSS
ncbi:hypothetical protein [Sorangium sp. So ce363]|uniref:hypothetical protein n=1 Tax=Sorangium sp. So ce363 TaxID=3133304 RepID=UPI003F642F67